MHEASEKKLSTKEKQTLIKTNNQHVKLNTSNSLSRRRQGIDYSRVINSDSIKHLDEIIKCKICFQILVNSVDCSGCQKSFCYDCIQILKENNKICPFGCDYSLNEIKNSSIAIRTVLSFLQFSCIYPECKEISIYSDVLQHEENCDYAIVSCPNLNCSKNILKRDFESHVKEQCEYNCINCESCGKDIKRSDFNKHSAICKGIFGFISKQKSNKEGSKIEEFFNHILSISNNLKEKKLENNIINEKIEEKEYEKEIMIIKTNEKKEKIENPKENQEKLNFFVIEKYLEDFSKNFEKISEENNKKYEKLSNSIEKINGILEKIQENEKSLLDITINKETKERCHHSYDDNYKIPRNEEFNLNPNEDNSIKEIKNSKLITHSELIILNNKNNYFKSPNPKIKFCKLVTNEYIDEDNMLEEYYSNNKINDLKSFIKNNNDKNIHRESTAKKKKKEKIRRIDENQKIDLNNQEFSLKKMSFPEEKLKNQKELQKKPNCESFVDIINEEIQIIKKNQNLKDTEVIKSSELFKYEKKQEESPKEIMKKHSYIERQAKEENDMNIREQLVKFFKNSEQKYQEELKAFDKISCIFSDKTIMKYIPTESEADCRNEINENILQEKEIFNGDNYNNPKITRNFLNTNQKNFMDYQQNPSNININEEITPIKINNQTDTCIHRYSIFEELNNINTNMQNNNAELNDLKKKIFQESDNNYLTEYSNNTHVVLLEEKSSNNRLNHYPNKLEQEKNLEEGNKNNKKIDLSQEKNEEDYEESQSEESKSYHSINKEKIEHDIEMDMENPEDKSKFNLLFNSVLIELNKINKKMNILESNMKSYYEQMESFPNNSHLNKMTILDKSKDKVEKKELQKFLNLTNNKLDDLTNLINKNIYRNNTPSFGSNLPLNEELLNKQEICNVKHLYNDDKLDIYSTQRNKSADENALTKQSGLGNNYEINKTDKSDPNQQKNRFLNNDIRNSYKNTPKTNYDNTNRIFDLIMEKLEEQKHLQIDFISRKITENIEANYELNKSCIFCLKIKYKFEIKECFTCLTKFCKDCAQLCEDCGSILCPNCIGCKICQESICVKCRKACNTCKIEFSSANQAQNSKSFLLCDNCLTKCHYCNQLNCLDCIRKCLKCNKHFCHADKNYKKNVGNCSKSCKNCSKSLCMSCEGPNDFMKCPCCKEFSCLNCTSPCLTCKHMICKLCVDKCKKCQRNICKNCCISCNNCREAFCSEICSKQNFKSKCKKCSKNFCNMCVKEYTLKCTFCKESLCKKCSQSCGKCNNDLCSNLACNPKCDNCSSDQCSQCLILCVCKKYKFCETCSLDISPINPHDCNTFANDTPFFKGLKGRSKIVLPKGSFEMKMFLEKYSGENISVGITDNSLFDEDTMLFIDNIWVLKLNNGMKYSSENSLETCLKSGGLKAFDFLYLMIENGNSLTFRINNHPKQIAYNIDPKRDYYLYMENDDNNRDIKITIIYIKRI